MVCVALAVESAQGCDVPVFRYALERWRSDVYIATVFHRGELSERDADAVATYRKQSILEEGTANLEVRSCDVSLPVEPRHVDLWNQQPPDAPLPRVVLQSPVVKGRRFVVWAGGLGEFDSEGGTFTVIEQYEPVDLVDWAVASSVAPSWAAMKLMLAVGLRPLRRNRSEEPEKRSANPPSMRRPPCQKARMVSR